MNFGTFSGFVARNGKGILKKTAVAAGLIAGLAFLTDNPEVEEDDELFVEETEDDVIRITEDDGTEVN